MNEEELSRPAGVPEPGVRPPAQTTGLIREVLSTLLPALLIAVLMHLFLAQSTIVYGQSMEPNYHTDERLIIEKLTYYFHPPQRGDVVVIKDPSGGSTPLIKRVVALAGERVTIANGQVFINGQALREPYLSQITDGRSRSWVVPPLHIFVLGDNRGNSRDSRVFGPVPLGDVLGHAVFRYWPLEDIGAPR